MNILLYNSLILSPKASVRKYCGKEHESASQGAQDAIRPKGDDPQSEAFGADIRRKRLPLLES